MFLFLVDNRLITDFHSPRLRAHSQAMDFHSPCLPYPKDNAKIRHVGGHFARYCTRSYTVAQPCAILHKLVLETLGNQGKNHYLCKQKQPTDNNETSETNYLFRTQRHRNTEFFPFSVTNISSLCLCVFVF